VLSFDSSDQKSMSSSKHLYLPRMTAGFGSLDEMLRSSVKPQHTNLVSEHGSQRVTFNPDWHSPGLRQTSAHKEAATNQSASSSTMLDDKSKDGLSLDFNNIVGGAGVQRQSNVYGTAAQLQRGSLG